MALLGNKMEQIFIAHRNSWIIWKEPLMVAFLLLEQINFDGVVRAGPHGPRLICARFRVVAHPQEEGISTSKANHCRGTRNQDSHDGGFY